MPPTRGEVERVTRRVRDRALGWLKRRGYVDQRPLEARSNEAPSPSALEACAELALAGGAFLERPVERSGAGDEPFGDKRERRFSASVDGFDLHCAVRIRAGDDEGRERLVRYCCRPAFALERITRLTKGRVAYEMKTPRRGKTHRVMSAVEFLARIASLVPPPRFPLVRYHGVLAPASSWRKLVVPRPPRRAKPCAATTPAPVAKAEPRARGREMIRNVPQCEEASPTVLSVKHWGRLLDGALLATSPRIEWSKLLQRTFTFDVLRCPRCSARMRVLAAVTDGSAARRILDHLGVRSNAPPVAPARDPTDQAAFAFDA